MNIGGPAPPARQISAHLKRGRQPRRHPSFRGMLDLLFPKSRSVPVSAYPPIPPVEVGTTFAADHGDSEGAGEPREREGPSPNVRGAGDTPSQLPRQNCFNVAPT